MTVYVCGMTTLYEQWFADQFTQERVEEVTGLRLSWPRRPRGDKAHCLD